MPLLETMYVDPRKINSVDFQVLIFLKDISQEVAANSLDSWEGDRIGLLKESNSANKKYKASGLSKNHRGLASTLETCAPGDYILVAKDMNGHYYKADDQAPLFEDWNALDPDVQRNLSERARTQFDPFRQALLDTLIALPPEQILSVFGYGMDEGNHLLMAIAVQALPDNMLDDEFLSNQLNDDLYESFKQFCGKDDELPSLAASFPFFYAKKRLATGKRYCHELAFKDVIAFSTNSPLFTYGDGDEDIIEEVIKRQEQWSTGLTVTAARHISSEKGVNEALRFLYKLHVSNKFDNESIMDSLTIGFRQREGKAICDIFDIAVEVIGSNKISEIIAADLMDKKNKYNGMALPFVSALMDKLGNAIIIPELENKIAKSSELRNTRLAELIQDSVSSRWPMTDITRGLMHLHTDHFIKLGPCMLQTKVDYLVNTPDALDIYTSRTAIDNAVEYAFSLIARHEDLAASESSERLNAVFRYIAANNRSRTGSSPYGPASAAIRLVSLSTTRHPDLLKQLNAASAEHLLERLRVDNIPFDVKEMALLLPEVKAKLLEDSMGL